MQAQPMMRRGWEKDVFVSDRYGEEKRLLHGSDMCPGANVRKRELQLCCCRLDVGLWIKARTWFLMSLVAHGANA